MFLILFLNLQIGISIHFLTNIFNLYRPNVFREQAFLLSKKGKTVLAQSEVKYEVLITNIARNKAKCNITSFLGLVKRKLVSLIAILYNFLWLQSLMLNLG